MGFSNSISVVVPLHNKAVTIGRAIDSVLSCGKVDEVIVVNDASSDGSEDVVKSYCQQDARVRVFHREYRNVSETRNAGFELARGNLVCFLDADDYWLGDAATLILRMAEHYPEHKFFGFGHRVLSSKGDVGNFPRAPIEDIHLANYCRSVSFQNYWKIPRPFRVLASAVAFRKPLIHLSSLFNPNLRFGEDLELWIKASRYGDFLVCNLPLVAIDRTDAVPHVYNSGSQEDWALLFFALREAFRGEAELKHFWDRKMAHEMLRTLQTRDFATSWRFFGHISWPHRLLLPATLAASAVRRSLTSLFARP